MPHVDGDFQSNDEPIVGDVIEPVMLGVVPIKSRTTQTDLNRLVDRILRLIGHLDDMTSMNSETRRLLYKTGLVAFAKRFRN